MKLPAVFTPLRHGPFARYIAGEAISMTGTWMQTLAQNWVLTSLTSSAFALGGINFAAGVPMLLLTIVGGTFADRYDKRVILHLALGIQLVNAALIGWLVATGQIAIWHMFVSAVVLGITAAFEVPTVSAFVPELVPREQMSNAIALDRSVFHATRFLGPALGGALTTAFGVATAYFINAASYLALIAAILTIPKRPRGTDAEEEQRRGSFREGWNYVRKDPPTFGMILLLTAMTTFVSPFIMIMMPLYVRNSLGQGPDSLGWLMALSGVGSFVGSLGLLAIPCGKRAIYLRAAGIAVTLAMIGLGTATSFWAAGAAMILLTLGASTSFGVANIVVQERAPDALRGRVSAVTSLSFFGILPFSGLFISGLVDVLGMRAAFLTAAACFGAGAFILLAGKSHLASAPPVAAALEPEIDPGTN